MLTTPVTVPGLVERGTPFAAPDSRGAATSPPRALALRPLPSAPRRPIAAIATRPYPDSSDSPHQNLTKDPASRATQLQPDDPTLRQVKIMADGSQDNHERESERPRSQANVAIGPTNQRIAPSAGAEVAPEVTRGAGAPVLLPQQVQARPGVIDQQQAPQANLSAPAVEIEATTRPQTSALGSSIAPGEQTTAAAKSGAAALPPRDVYVERQWPWRPSDSRRWGEMHGDAEYREQVAAWEARKLSQIQGGAAAAPNHPNLPPSYPFATPYTPLPALCNHLPTPPPRPHPSAYTREQARPLLRPRRTRRPLDCLR